MSVEEHARAGIEAINDKRFTDAIGHFEAALREEPDRPDMTNALGMAHLHRGDAGNAITHLERAVELAEPYESDEHQDMKRHFHSGLAAAYSLMDRVGDSVRVLRGMVERWPSDLEAHLQLGQTLLASCQLDEALEAYSAATAVVDKEGGAAIAALSGAIAAWRESEEPAKIFLEAHAQSYADYFDEVAKEQEEQGWYAEAARMSKVGGEVVPVVADGARPYALTRVDLVNPADGTVSSVYSDKEPMIVAVDGLDPLAHMAVMLPWDAGYPFDVWVCTRSPWHWLPITIQVQNAALGELALVETIDALIGDWYLAGYNGEFGTGDRGRFHYITDPDTIGGRAVSYTVDLGRADFAAVSALLRRLAVLHDSTPIDRVLLGQGRLPD